MSIPPSSPQSCLSAPDSHISQGSARRHGIVPHTSFPRPSCTGKTEILEASHDGVERAASLIRRGGIVAFGTETVYGLGTLATSPSSVQRVFSIKGRPSFNPLIAHFASAQAAFAEAAMDNMPLAALARTLAKYFWPGPLTLILPRNPQSTICDMVTAGLPSLAVRVPRGRAVQNLLRQVNVPVAAPSANISGRVSPSTAAHVITGLGGLIDAILDTGPCMVGVESTVLDLTGEAPVLLRPGGVTREELEIICGTIATAPPPAPSSIPDAASSSEVSFEAPRSPGQLLSHYAPNLPLRLEATSLEEGEALLAFGNPLPLPNPQTPCWNLSPSGDLKEAAARLFAGLRFLDETSKTGHTTPIYRIAVQPFPTHGLGLALWDRLQRAAAPRPDKHTE